MSSFHNLHFGTDAPKDPIFDPKNPKPVFYYLDQINDLFREAVYDMDSEESDELTRCLYSVLSASHYACNVHVGKLAIKSMQADAKNNEDVQKAKEETAEAVNKFRHSTHREECRALLERCNMTYQKETLVGECARQTDAMKKMERSHLYKVASDKNTMNLIMKTYEIEKSMIRFQIDNDKLT